MDYLNSTISNWRKVRRLSGRERALLLESLVLLPLVWLGLRLFGLRRMRPLAGLARTASRLSGEQAQRTAGIVGLAARHGLYRATCLEESLALLWMLGRRATPASLHLGFRKDGGQFEAHAWVECGGIVLNDSTDVAQRYSAFPSLW